MIIVTGGAGFIGSALIWQLNQSSYNDILVVDDLGSGTKWKNLAKRSIHDIISIEAFPNFLKEYQGTIDAIFHMGACSSTVEEDGDFLMRNNVHYSMMLFDYALKKRIPFIYASSAATYGRKESNFSDNPDELNLLRPINKYGYSKYLFDQWVMKQPAKPPIWAGLKFFNVYGPGENHKGGQASVAFHAYPQIKANGSLKLFKSYRPDISHGEQKRDFVYVKDVVKVCEHFLNLDDKKASGIYNVGTGKARTFLDLMLASGAAFELKATPEFIEMPESIREHYQYFTEANLERLRQNGQYHQEFTSLEEGVNDYYSNYLMQEDPYF